MDQRLFDIKSYLRDRKVKITPTGKNVSEGWISIQCIWCDDESNHLGINIYSKAWKCWVCGKKGPIIDIVKQIDSCGHDTAREIMEGYVDLSAPKELIRGALRKEGNVLPKEATEEFPSIHLDYLSYRNFIPEIVIPKYQLKACYNTGKYKFRIIIPIIMNHRVVAFTSRDITNKAHLKYKTIERDLALKEPEEWIYNIDTIQDKIVIVEGPTDVWRLGDGAVALLGSVGSNQQLIAIKRRRVKLALVLFDAEEQAQKNSEKICKNLALLGIPVYQLSTTEGDPSDLSEKEVNEFWEFVDELYSKEMRFKD